MELGKRIREYRNALKWNQDELAEKMFVSRQTISSWENDKSYPDVQSLLLLSNLFDVSLDQLVKGDVKVMEELINEQEIKKMDHYSKLMTGSFVVTILVVIPLFIWVGYYAIIPFGIMYAITMYWAIKVEKIKKENDIQTYKEIVAFSKGEKLDEISKQREIGKRPYQKVMLVFATAIITVVVCFAIGFIMDHFLG